MWVIKGDMAVNLNQTKSFERMKDLIIFNYGHEKDADILVFKSESIADIAFDEITEELNKSLPVLILG